MINRSAKLLDDATFVSAYEAQSTYPFNYHTALPPSRFESSDGFKGSCPSFAGGCKQFNVVSTAVDDYNAKILPGAPGYTRIGTKSSTSTVLQGGPFAARGEGILKNPDALTQAWTPNSSWQPHCNKRLSEVTYNTWSCIEAPQQSEAVLDKRGGIGTRMGLEYISPC